MVGPRRFLPRLIKWWLGSRWQTASTASASPPSPRRSGAEFESESSTPVVPDAPPLWPRSLRRTSKLGTSSISAEDRSPPNTGSRPAALVSEGNVKFHIGSDANDDDMADDVNTLMPLLAIVPGLDAVAVAAAEAIASETTTSDDLSDGHGGGDEIRELRERRSRTLALLLNASWIDGGRWVVFAFVDVLAARVTAAATERDVDEVPDISASWSRSWSWSETDLDGSC